MFITLILDVYLFLVFLIQLLWILNDPENPLRFGFGFEISYKKRNKKKLKIKKRTRKRNRTIEDASSRNIFETIS